MSYFTFFKQILCYPIEFLDSYFKDDKTERKLEDKAFFFAFKFPIAVYLLIFFIFYLVFFLKTMPFISFAFSFMGILFSLLGATFGVSSFILIEYLIFSIRKWIFIKCIKWSGIACTAEKAKCLFLYYTASLNVLNTCALFLYTGFYLLLLGLFRCRPSVPSLMFFLFTLILVIFLLAATAYQVYQICLSYVLMHKATGISLVVYIKYFVIVPTAIWLSVFAIVCFILVASTIGLSNSFENVLGGLNKYNFHLSSQF